MTPQEQAEFIRAHAEQVLEKAAKQAAAGKLPEDWDGFELKVYLADCFDPKFGGDAFKKRKAKCKRQISYLPS